MPSMQYETRIRILVICVIFMVALALRLAWVQADVPSTPEDTDAYGLIASHLLAGRGYSIDGSSPTAYRAPGFPLFVALVQWAFGGVRAVLWAQCILGAAVVVLAALIARNLTGDLFAPVAALAVAVDPFHVGMTSQLMSETFFSFLATAALFLVIWAMRARKLERYILAGLATGAAAITRPEFLLFVPGAAAAAALWGRRRRRFLCVAIFVFAAAVPVGIWGARNRRALGEWVFTTTHGGYTHLLAFNEIFYREVVAGPHHRWTEKSLEEWQDELAGETAMMSEPQRDRYYYRRAGELTSRHPLAAAHIALYGAVRFWRPAPSDGAQIVRLGAGAFFVVLAVFAVAGMYVTWRRRGVPQLILYVMFFETVVHMYYWSNLRMRIPFHPMLAVMAAAGIAALFGSRALVGPAVSVDEREALYSPAIEAMMEEGKKCRMQEGHR